MFTRLNLIRRGYCLSQLILIKYRPIHLTSRLAINDPIPPTKKEPVTTSTRSALSPSEISELVLKRLHLHGQRGIVKALIIGSGIVLVSTVLFLYVFRKPLKNQTVAQVADVARSSLEQGKLPSFPVLLPDVTIHAKDSEHFKSFFRQCKTTSKCIISRINSKSFI